MGAAIVVCCVLLLLGGIAAVVRWGGLPLQPPPQIVDGQILNAQGDVRRALWWAGLLVQSGIASGLLIAGPGGRLAMRLLAATAGDDAQGQLTEAEERVGVISLDGTIGFLVFGGLFAGLATALAYLAVRRWLPSGRAGGLVLGGILLAVGATRIEPLRADNPDFDLVGPDWLAVTVFIALVLAQAMGTVAVANRLSASLPLATVRPRTLLAYSPVLLLALTGPGALFVAAVAAVLVLLARQPLVRRAWRSGTVVLAGRGLLALAVALTLPGALGALRDILRSG